MLGIIILLKDNFIPIELVVFDGLKKIVIENIRIKLSIHVSIYSTGISNPLCCHTPPKHKAPTTKLDSSLHLLVIQLIISWPFPYPTMSKRLIFVSSDQITHFQSSTVQY